MGGAGAGMLLSFVFSRFGIVGVIVVLGLMFLIGGNPLGLSDSGQQAVPNQRAGSTQSAEQVCQSDPAIRFSCSAPSTEDGWSELSPVALDYRAATGF